MILGAQQLPTGSGATCILNTFTALTIKNETEMCIHEQELSSIF